MLMTTTKSYSSYQWTVQTPEITGSEQAQVVHILDTWWLFGVMIIIILEMATPIWILFPTDAIVFWSGLYFSGKNSIWWWIWMLMVWFSIAVVLWDLLWYWRGSLLSSKLQVMKDNWIFKKKYLTMCQHYFDDYGNKTMIVSKFLPIRSVIPIVAGAILKPFFPFFLQSILSAVLWIGSLVGVSYFIIYLIPAAANHVALLTFLFVVVPQLVSVVYMIRPMIQKYETRLSQASKNLQQISSNVSEISSEFSHIWSQFVSIGHEVKEIVQKVISQEDTSNSNNASDTNPVIINPWPIDSIQNNIPVPVPSTSDLSVSL